MEDSTLIAILVIAVLVLVSVTGIASYHHGRKAERRALTMELIAQIEDIYIEGRTDGRAECGK
jgi:uncharacterized membrane protein YidH (DUF202 family)